jgi:hypothetical protein
MTENQIQLISDKLLLSCLDKEYLKYLNEEEIKFVYNLTEKQIKNL